MIGKVTHLWYKIVEVPLTLSITQLGNFLMYSIIIRPFKIRIVQYSSPGNGNVGPRQGEFFVPFLCDIWEKYRCLSSIYCTLFEFFFFLQRTIGENAPSEEISDVSDFLFDIVVKYIHMKICMKNNDTRSWVNRKHCKQPEIIKKNFRD
jgi:hypothetical protein